MLSIELIINQDGWKDKEDLLDYTGNIKMIIGERDLPPRYNKDGIEVRLYETTFEFLDLLNNILNVFKLSREGNPDNTHFKAEFCYTGNFIFAWIDGRDNNLVRVRLEFNPVEISDDDIMSSGGYEDSVSLENFAFEILYFSISVVEAFLEHDPALQDDLESMERFIMELRSQLEKDFDLTLSDEK